MNERIRGLANKAGFEYSKTMAYTSKQDGVDIIALEKFAELIVQECAKLFEDDGSASSMSEYVHNGRTKETILKHFGIKE